MCFLRKYGLLSNHVRGLILDSNRRKPCSAPKHDREWMYVKKPDILMFMSDQHAYSYTGFTGHPVLETPNLDRIARSGVSFDNMYTSCPLCVPARLSMITARMPSNIGVMNNPSLISEDTATFLHALVAAGYETVLCGRMHFKGCDQLKGFSRRIFPELLPSFWGKMCAPSRYLGRFAGTFAEYHCLDYTGADYSPVLEYDEHVIDAALRYLSDEHDKPQFILVGTYGPHFSYVAPEAYYNKYLGRVPAPVATDASVDYEMPAIRHKQQFPPAETLDSARAAYCGMIDKLDGQIGAVYDRYQTYLSSSGRQGIFIYTSDHGDQVGERSLFGKKTFFEDSAKIPFFITGAGIPAGVRCAQAAGIIDIAPTILRIALAQALPLQDGRALDDDAPDTRFALSECVIDDNPNGPTLGRMVKMDCWKYITYSGYERYDLLFNTRDDPHELHNALAENREMAALLRAKLAALKPASIVLREYAERTLQQSVVGLYHDVMRFDDGRFMPTIPPKKHSGA